MRSLRSALITCFLVATPLVASAQAPAPIEVPALSPKAKVEQRVGVTDFAIEYSSPAVKGRKVWGTLVPYGKIWRAGANASTKLTASRDFTFGGTPVKAGTYSIFMMPGRTTWTVHLNSDPTAGQNNHDPKKDVAKVTVRPITMPAARERLLYLFDRATDDKVSLELEWDRVRVEVPITVDTKAHVAAAIARANGEAWRPHFMLANYLNDSGDVAQALTLVEKSIAIQPTWRNEWLRAQIHRKQGKKAEALAGAKRAQQLGTNDPIYEQFFKADIAKAVNEWK